MFFGGRAQSPDYTPLQAGEMSIEEGHSVVLPKEEEEELSDSDGEKGDADADDDVDIDYWVDKYRPRTLDECDHHEEVTIH